MNLPMIVKVAVYEGSVSQKFETVGLLIRFTVTIPCKDYIPNLSYRKMLKIEP